MSRFAIDFIPRASWQQDVDPADQRWTRTPNVFSGTEEQATLECSELEAAHDRQVTFRAVPLETLEPEHHFCPGCAGDYRERIGHQLACTCPMAIASTAGFPIALCKCGTRLTFGRHDYRPEWQCWCPDCVDGDYDQETGRTVATYPIGDGKTLADALDDYAIRCDVETESLFAKEGT